MKDNLELTPNEKPLVNKQQQFKVQEFYLQCKKVATNDTKTNLIARKQTLHNKF